MKATATNAAEAPNAADHKDPLDMTDAEFDAHLKATNVWGKNAERRRQTRRERIAQRAAQAQDVRAAQAQDLLDAQRETNVVEIHAVPAENGGGAAQRPAPADGGNEEDDRHLAAAGEAVAQGLARAAKGRGTLSALQRKADVPLQPAAPKGPDSAATKAGALRTRFIDPNLIDIQEGWNSRIDMGDIEELGRSIKAQKVLDGHGLVNDIRVKEKADGRYDLVDGERRYLAIMGLQDAGEVWEFGVPAKVEAADATEPELIIKMFVANHGKPFLPYEEAIYYKRLRDEGWTLDQIEKATGRSDNSIVGALALLEADDDLVDAVTRGQIGATMAKSIAVNVRGNKARQKELVAKAKAAKKSGQKGALARVNKEIDEERRAKAARKMPKLQLKARMADQSEINHLGAAVAARLKELMEKNEMAVEDTDLAEWTSNDRELQIAAEYGALTALRWVMGEKVKVHF